MNDERRRTTTEIEALLNRAIPAEVIRRNPKGMDYVDGYYVIMRLNEVFGHDGWTTRYGAPVIREGEKRTIVYVECKLSIHAERDILTRCDIGVGISANLSVDSFETAIKGAYTDALKRCARTLGPVMGLALYEHVEGSEKREGVGASFEAQALIAEIATLATMDDCKAWALSNKPVITALSKDDVSAVRGALDARMTAVKVTVATP